MATEDSQRLDVLIAGGGVAALEGVLALRELAGARAALRLVAPTPEFVYRPMTVQEPFAFAQARRYPLDEIAHDLDIDLLEDSIARIDPDRRVLTTESGRELGFGALLLGVGARPRARYEHAVTIDDRRLDEQLHGLVQDIEAGLVRRLGFVIPGRMAWPLPLYELALLSATRAYEMGVELAVTIVTPEDAPLAVFGTTVSEAVGERLERRGIEVVSSAYAEVPSGGHVSIRPRDRVLEFDRVVALPELDGPALEGLPVAEDGFIPIDDHCQVRGVEGVYAAGDATDFAVKHGGIAAQQADAAAEAIAALAGADVQPGTLRPVIRGTLLTGEQPIYLSAQLSGGRGVASEVSERPPSDGQAKISARYLAPYLERRDGGR